jgi:two-component system NtrC family sensor kinase
MTGQPAADTIGAPVSLGASRADGASTARRTQRRSRRRSDAWITVAVVVGSLALTAAMSAIQNHGAVRTDFLITGGVCAVVLERMVARATGHYRRELAIANQVLEQRVSERTIDLAAANASLREAAAAQAALRDELLARDRLATAGMLAAGVSHEIRSPLTVISMGVDEIDASLAGGDGGVGGVGGVEDLRAIVADVRAASDQIAVVVRDLTSLAKPAHEPIGPLALAPVIATAVRLAGYQLRTGCSLVLAEVSEVQVVGNSSRLVQVVLNLLTNAARATRAGVVNTIAIGAEARADVVALRVTDTGCGMSSETLARLFTPFFTMCADRGGTGLGLSICRTIIERMGGAIDVESTLGVGTTVEVRLPRA